MPIQKKGLIKADDQTRKTVQQLLKMREDHAEEIGKGSSKFQEVLHEEFHQVWEETIRPALEQLKSTTAELLDNFSEFEDDFRGYLRGKQPDVDVELLEEIYGDTLRAKADEKHNGQTGEAD